MAIVTHKDLSKIRKQYKDKKIVFCSGSFDLIHVGHILFLEDCKKHGDLLVVVVGGDAVVRKNKGKNRPVLNEKIRLKTIDSLKPVDYALLDKTKSHEHAQKGVKLAFEKLKPDIYVINKDSMDIPFKKEFSKKYGVKLVVLDRWSPREYGPISTSSLIEKIKKL